MNSKILKWAVWAMMIIGVVLTAWVFQADGSDASVNALLYCAYAMLGIAIAAIVYGVVRDGMINPKSFVKVGIVLGGLIVIVGVAYLLAPGSQPIGYVGAQPSKADLMLTDTILNITYFAVAASIAAIVFAAVWDNVKGK